MVLASSIKRLNVSYLVSINMSVTSNIPTNQRATPRFSWQLTLTPKRLASFMIVQGLLFTGCVILTYQHFVLPEQLAQGINNKSTEISEQRARVSQLKSQTHMQLAVLAQRMGSLTGRMNRIDALGERLAKNSDIEEFDFGLLPAVGGPSLLSEQSQSSELSALLKQMDSVMGHLDQQHSQLAILENVMLNHDIDDNSRIEGRPIKRGWMSSLYGMRNDPFNGRLAMHKGVDFAGTEGSPVMATGAGVISWASERSGYGLLVEIDHGAGLKTRYGHAKEILVTVGDVVAKGETVALMGNTGRSTGPHVHYEVLAKERQVNPRKYIYR